MKGKKDINGTQKKEKYEKPEVVKFRRQRKITNIAGDGGSLSPVPTAPSSL